MLISTRYATVALCPLVVAVLAIACNDSGRGPTTAPDAPPLFESGSGSDGSGSGSGSGSGDGGGGSTTPTTGTGQVQIVQGGTGRGTITSQPTGINCTVGGGDPTGPCAASFVAGTRVRLEARAATGSEFRGWALTTSCQKAPDVTVIANAVHSCQPVFQPKS